jgi:glyoxylase-like metal-dependent hydrolase (beta-lactamase superfamily II)
VSAVKFSPVVALLVLLGMGGIVAQQQPLVGEVTTRVSDHVWAIMGFPNIGIVVGTRATLVVDTGLGPRNGETVARIAARLSHAPKLFLTTTHFHPEHAAGEPGFPPGVVLIRNVVQQREMVQHGQEILEQFRSRPQNAALLPGNLTLRTPDVLFETEATVDLGDATARLLWVGEAHTKGDLVVFVEPDGTLVSGDLVQNKVVPNIASDGGTPSSWLAALDKLAQLKVQHVLPDHSPVGDGSLIADERAFIGNLRVRALTLKKSGVSAADAGTRLSGELRQQYADWGNLNVGGFVQRIYAEGE